MRAAKTTRIAKKQNLSAKNQSWLIRPEGEKRAASALLIYNTTFFIPRQAFLI
jgi:hypothetical protein